MKKKAEYLGTDSVSSENEALRKYRKAYAAYMKATDENGPEAAALLKAEQQLDLAKKKTKDLKTAETMSKAFHDYMHQGETGCLLSTGVLYEDVMNAFLAGFKAGEKQ